MDRCPRAQGYGWLPLRRPAGWGTAVRRLVIYHAGCIDGFTAAYAAWVRYGDGAEFLPAAYGDAPPDVAGRDVLVVDFSYRRPVMLEMASKASSLLVLDHHKTAEAELAGLHFAIFDMERSGAGLTWDTLNGTGRPWLVDYVEDRDLWRFRLPDSKAVNAWIGAQRKESFQEWAKFCALDLESVVAAGGAVLSFIDRYVHEVGENAIRVVFAGHSVPLVNAPHVCISELVGHLAASEPFAMGWHQRSDGRFAYSLRSRGDIDVSEIAKKYGGGGHKGAAGFVCDEPLSLTPRQLTP